MEKDRIALYKFLSIGFTYPEISFDEIMEKSIELVSKSYTNLNKKGYKLTGIKNLKKGLKELSSAGLGEWQGIYTSLFISNIPRTPLHPYESFYKEGLLVSESSDELNEIYSSCGVEIFDDKEFPDIVNFELEFASFIIENQSGCLPIFKVFFREHLFSWIFDFFNDVEQYKETPLFYLSLAQIGKNFLKKEQKIMEEILNER